jgi:uncharacterized protein YgiM (DUF1202 family)
MGFSAGQFVQVNTPSGVNFRSLPAVDPQNLVGTIPNGSVMQVVGESKDGWTNVLWGGKTGWVSEQYVIGAQATQVPTGTLEVTGSAVNVRYDPALASPVETQTGPSGDQVESVGLAINQYVAIAYKGMQGYISAAYVRQPGQSAPIARTLPNVPAVTPQTPGAMLPAPSVPVQHASATVPSKAPSGPMLAGGLLALALVLYFVAK